ncbi:MAG: hypothetical protein NTW03_01135, partial [Verrucomicrobia bacterium]|nr:hypothetical protein [Verrucomicrobiota bacterium]
MKHFRRLALSATALFAAAVCSTASEVAPLADVLVAAFSARGSVTLLEREQIQKLWREQELAAGQRPDSVKLGRLLGADGLLWLERQTEGTNELLAVRLVAVKPGVILAEHRFPFAMNQPAEWGTAYAAQIEQLLPKLAVKLEEAVPISVLNLRSSIATSESAILEQELTTLLRFRLVREPALFLLERRGLEEMEEEKQLKTSESEPFWNGAYVLDGTINRDVVSHETVVINARLAPPRGAPVNLEVSGRRDAIAAVADELVRKILAATGKAGTAEAWRPEAEAEKFFQEATWAWAWKLWPQAAEAADGSWALGRRTREVGAYRVGSRAWLALSMRARRSYDYVGVGVYGFRPPPSPEVLPLVGRTLELYRELFWGFARETNGPGKAWGSMGLDLLLVTARVLEQYHEQVERREGHAEDLRRVRELAREVNTLLTTNQSLGSIVWRRNLEGLPGVYWHTKHGPVTFFCEAWLDAGGMWFEKPAAAIELYRALLNPSVYPSARGALLGAGQPLAAWSGSDRQDLALVWMRFLREMAASTNTLVQLDGLRLILALSLDPPELENTAERYAEAAWTARLSIFRGEVDSPAGQVLTNLIRRVEPWGRPPVEKLQSLAQDWSRRYTEAQPDLGYETWKDLVSRLEDPSTRSADFRPPPVPPRPPQVRELITRLEALGGGGQGRLGPIMARHYLKQLRDSTGLAGPEVKPAPAEAAAPRGVAPSESARLRVSRVWSMGAAQLPAERRFAWDPRAKNLSWQQGRLWLEADTFEANGQNLMGRPCFVALDTPSMRFELFEAPAEEVWYPTAPRRGLVVGEEMFVCVGSALWHRGARGNWTSVPLAVPAAQPCWWGGRLVLSSDDGIYSVDPRTGEVRVLASRRRYPPVTDLDRIAGVREAKVVVWPDDTLCALVGGKVWTCDLARQNWTLRFACTNLAESLDLDATGVFYRQSLGGGPGLLGGLRPGSSVLHATGVFYGQSSGGRPGLFGGWRPGSSVLDFYTWEKGSGAQWGDFTPPIWIQPPEFQAHRCRAAFDGPNAWALPAAATVDPFAPAPPRSLVLFDGRYQRALEFRMEFAGPAAEFEKPFEAARANPRSHLEFLATPAGLAFLLCEGGTLLWIPKVDLDNALAEALRRAPQPECLQFATLRRFD